MEQFQVSAQSKNQWKAVEETFLLLDIYVTISIV